MIALASDHGGFLLKQAISNYLKEQNIAFFDYGTYDEASVDYPVMVSQPCSDIQTQKVDKGIFVCGTGIGISIAANKHNGIRAACVSESYSAKLAREHNDANVLCLGGRVISSEYALSIVEIFLSTEFSGVPRHKDRIAQITKIEESQK